MTSASVLARLHIEFKHDREGIARCVALLEEGAPAPFVARYRRPETLGLDEHAILAVGARLEQLTEIERRRATILRGLEQLGRATPAMRARLETTFDRAKLEDLYRPHRPKKKTRCAQALAAGLAPFAEEIATGRVSEGELQAKAAAHVKPEAGFADAAQVLDGVAHILGEWVADDPYVRQHVREELRKRGRLRVHPIEGAKGAERHRAVAQIDEPLLRVAPHRYLLVRRGEREKALRAEIAIDPEEILGWIEARYLDGVRATNTRRRGARRKGGDGKPGDPAHDDAARDDAEHSDAEHDDAAHDDAAHSDAALAVDAAHHAEHVHHAEHAHHDEDAGGAEPADHAAHPEHESGEKPVSEGQFEGFTESPYEGAVPGAEESGVPALPSEEQVHEELRDSGEVPGAAPAEAEGESEGETEESAAPADHIAAEASTHAAGEDHADAVPAPPHPAPPAQPLQGEVRELVRLAIRSAFTRWILGSCEEDVRLDAKQRCEQELLRGYQRNLRSLLLAPCAGHVVVLGFDPAPRGAWRYAIADAAGVFVAEGALTSGEDEAGLASREAFFQALEQRGVRMIAVGNGEASKKIARALRPWLAQRGSRVPLALTVESGAGEHAASARGRAEHPQLDPAVRAAIGLARRAQDPLAEIAKADWRHLGLGPLQSEVGKGRLHRALEETMRSVVAHVGVDLSSAQAELLQYVPGFDAEKARAVVAERVKRGGFRRRRDLLEVPGIDAGRLGYAEGFLRFESSEDPLDRTHLLEEHRAVADALANAAAKPLAEIVGLRGALADLDLAALSTSQASSFGVEAELLRERLEIVRRELEHPARDTRARRRWPRPELTPAPGVALELGQEVEGVCSNVTSFGVFVDLGLEQDGLVHVSEMGGRFVRHPQDMAHVGDVVRARVLQIDDQRGRIALTLRPPQRDMRRRGSPPRGEAQPEDRSAPRGQRPEPRAGEPHTPRPDRDDRSPRRDQPVRDQPGRDRPGRERFEPVGNVRAADSRRDGLGGGRGGPGRGGPGRGRGPGGDRGSSPRGGPRVGGRAGDDRRGGPRSGGQGDDERRGGPRGEREDFGGEAAKPQRARETGWNPFRSFFGKGEEAAPAAQPAVPSSDPAPAVSEPQPEARPSDREDAGESTAVPPLIVDDAEGGDRS